MLSRLSLKVRVWIYLGGICLLVVAGFSGKELLNSSISQQIEATRQEIDTLKSGLADLKLHVYRTREAERAYFISGNLEDFESTKKSINDLRSEIAKLRRDGLDEVYPNFGMDTLRIVESYESSAKTLKDLFVEEGDKDSGIRGVIRNHAHKIESILKPLENNSPLYTHYLMIRRHEKDYILRRLDRYVGEIRDEGNAFKQTIAARSDIELATKQILYEILDDYHQQFASFYRLDQRKKEVTSDFDRAVEELASQIDLTEKRILEFEKDSIAQIGELAQVQTMISILTTIVTFLIIGFIVIQFRELSKKLAEIAASIFATSEETSEAGVELLSGSQKTSSATTEQASAIQETVATLNEISAMVNRSVENAKNSAEKANDSHLIASEGGKASEEMRQAMAAISTTIEELLAAVEFSNTRFDQVSKIIEKISEKTSVINEIVFQTKLLSFNASVEAARAKEHGRGFSVVAQEVGNLAQMSGQSAREISELLMESREQVSQILAESKQKVSELVEKGKQRIQLGTELSLRCNEILQSVVENSGTVREMMNDIAEASKEQAEGVQNISIAMNQLDESTHINSEVAHDTANCARTLAEQAKLMRSSVSQLEMVVFGNRSSSTHTSASLVTKRSSKPTNHRPKKQQAQASAGKSGKISNLPSADDQGWDQSDDDQRIAS